MGWLINIILSGFYRVGCINFYYLMFNEKYFWNEEGFKDWVKNIDNLCYSYFFIVKGILWVSLGIWKSGGILEF